GEVVALDPGERLGEGVAAEPRDQVRIRPELARRPLPDAPGARGAGAHRGVRAREPPVVRGDKVPSLLRRDRLEIRLPRVGVDEARPLLVEPGDLLGTHQEDPAEDEPAHAVGVALGVGEPERAAPRSAEDHPAVYPELLAEPLHVADEVPGGVVLEGGLGPALAGPSLV